MVYPPNIFTDVGLFWMFRFLLLSKNWLKNFIVKRSVRAIIISWCHHTCDLHSTVGCKLCFILFRCISSMTVLCFILKEVLNKTYTIFIPYQTMFSNRWNKLINVNLDGFLNSKIMKVPLFLRVTYLIFTIDIFKNYV